ncbi:hypothetical protein C8R43DRAFT_1195431 [Mycena crocata]|nr:hypothetical protein C8R43DRAFT_1195431 [Mycena crocata]
MVSLCCAFVALALSIIPAGVGSPLACDCRGTVGNDSKYLCGDYRLGPATFPKTAPLSTIVTDYDRLGGLCPGPFLQKYINTTSGYFVYPPQEGFQLSTTQMSINGNQTLVPGMRLDRFGSERGKYLAPAYTPFAQRALPPNSLNGKIGDPPANYHVYRVETSFTVVAGPIAAWFEQPGQGTQYLASFDIETLVNRGFLSKVKL